MKKNHKTKFSFKIDKKDLIRFSKMPVESRLKWLEETQKFLSSIKDHKIKNRWKIFHQKAS